MRILAILAAAVLVGGPALAATSEVTITPVGSSLPLPTTLMIPEGTGPFPAVVIMHDCSGLSPQSSHAPARWADELVKQGYAILIPDSFAPRGFPGGVCTEPFERSRIASGGVRALDAYGALAFLRSRPEVDGERIGIMGGSHGGWTTLASMYEPVRADDPLVEAKRHGFAAAIALYPLCTAPFGTWAVQRANGAIGPAVGHSGIYKPIAPVLILIGEKDDWTPARPCQWLVETAKAQGYPIDIKVYPDAYHSFDSHSRLFFNPQRTNGNNASGRGATTGGNPTAWADAKEQVRTFFARHLKPPR